MSGIGAVADHLAARVAAFRRDTAAPGIVAGVVLGNELAWTTAMGYADLEAARPIDERTPVRIASITKTLVATAIVQLRDEGRLRLDDPLVRHVPEFAAARNPYASIEQVTLRGLLTHTSGLQYLPPRPDPMAETFPGTTREEVLDRLDRTAIVIPPGRWKYSNLAYDLLGEVVRRVSAMDLERYLRERILEPLGMGSTGFALPARHEPPPASGYAGRAYGAPPSRVGDWDPAWDQPSGGLWAPLTDVAAWVRQQLRTGEDARRGPGQVLDGASLAEMHRPTVLKEGPWTYAQGLGWASYRRGDLVVTGHSGGVAGFRTTALFHGDDAFGVIVLLNKHDAVPALALDLAEIAWPAARDHRAVTAPVGRPGTVPPAFAPLLGTYREPERGDAWEVVVADGHLRVVAVGDPDERVSLVATDRPDRFLQLDGDYPGESLWFVRDAAGRAVRLVMGDESFARVTIAGGAGA